MQNASSNLTQVITGGGSTPWIKPRIFADWGQDGYGAAGSIDDLSDQAGGSPVQITQALDEGLPNELAINDLSTATATIPMGWGRGGLTASQYFSSQRADSPVVSYDRDVAPLKIDAGVVTSSGKEYVRVFTGQMQDTPVRGREATVQAISAARLKLAKLVWPWSLAGPEEGINGAWPVSWALAECGIYVSPPPRDVTQWWAPMHGSMRAFRPSFYPFSHGPQTVSTPDGPSFTGISGYNQFDYSTDGTTEILEAPPEWTIDGLSKWTDGPYTAAPYFRANTKVVFLGGGQIPLPVVDPAAITTGRVEFMVRGDAINENSSPGGSGGLGIIQLNFFGGFYTYVQMFNDADEIIVGIRRSDRKPVIRIRDGVTDITLVGSTALPSDGNWYSVGGAWDYASSQMSVYFNGTETITGGLGMNAANIASGAWVWKSLLPIAEAHLTLDTSVAPGATAWVFDSGYAWTRGATVGRSRLELMALVEPQPREAWEFIGSFAKAELASLRTDENDMVLYLPVSWWVENDRVNTAVDLFTPGTNMGDIDVKTDPSRIRNSARVSYSSTLISGAGAVTQESPAPSFTPPTLELVLGLSEVLPFLPGLTIVELAFDVPVIGITHHNPQVASEANGTITLVQDFLFNGFSPNLGFSWITLNTATDGSGTYAESADIGFTVSNEYTPVGVQILVQNKTGTTFYLANDQNIPALGIMGIGVHQTNASVSVLDENSIAVRGERAIPVDMPAIQTKENATWLATMLVGLHAYARPWIREVEVWADPRRQPGDVIRVDDSDNTGLDANMRTVSVGHTIDGAKYTQTVVAHEVDPTGTWDESTWDNCVWGE